MYHRRHMTNPPLSPTLGHVLPLSQGSVHSRLQHIAGVSDYSHGHSLQIQVSVTTWHENENSRFHLCLNFLEPFESSNQIQEIRKGSKTYENKLFICLFYTITIFFLTEANTLVICHFSRKHWFQHLNCKYALSYAIVKLNIFWVLLWFKNNKLCEIFHFGLWDAFNLLKEKINQQTNQ